MCIRDSIRRTGGGLRTKLGAGPDRSSLPAALHPATAPHDAHGHRPLPPRPNRHSAPPDTPESATPRNPAPGGRAGASLMSRYLYYPGCSMDGSGRAYGESLAGVCEQLGLPLAEIDDWNCCGATEYVGVSLSPAYALIARNLAIAAKSKQAGEPLLAACSACYLNLAKADHYMKERPLLNERGNVALDAGGLHYDPGTVEVRHLLEVIMNDVGLDQVLSLIH